jgi:hypothetical protein
MDVGAEAMVGNQRIYLQRNDHDYAIRLPY